MTLRSRMELKNECRMDLKIFLCRTLLAESNVACRVSINARVIVTRIPDSMGPCLFDPFFVNTCYAHVNAPTCPLNSWAISGLRKSTAPLASLSISVIITQVRSLSEWFSVKDINRKRPSLYSYASWPKLYTYSILRALYLELVSDYTSRTFIVAYQRFVSRRELSTSMYSNNGITVYTIAHLFVSSFDVSFPKWNAHARNK